MEKVKVLDKTFRTMVKHADIMAAISDVASRINRDYKDCEEPPLLLCILNGAIPFTAELMKQLNFDHELVCMKVKSYEGTASTGKVKVDMASTTSFKGRKVIIAEDIVDTGITIHFLKKFIKDEGASDVRVSTLMFKPESFSRNAGMLAGRGEQMTPPEYIGMSIPDAFILGFGMDYNEIGRNYRDIYVLDEQ